MFVLKLEKKMTPQDQLGFGDPFLAERLAKSLAEGFEDSLCDLEVFSCDRMAFLGLWTFDAFWFDKSWKLNVGWDLSTVVTFLPEVAFSLNKKQTAVISFFEQNISHEVNFVPIDDGIVRSEVKSLFAPLPADFVYPPNSRFIPPTATQDRHQLIENLRQTFQVYHEAVRDYCPEVWSAKLVQDFFNSPEVKFCLEPLVKR